MIGSMYSERTVTLAESRGFDRAAHLNALSTLDADAIATTHPANFLSEEEFEEAANAELDGTEILCQAEPSLGGQLCNLVRGHEGKHLFPERENTA